ncbi:MAG TPA: hypothetical protein VG266_07050 [Candidatus Dormibacteraeota bacterium]|nr:hypothetical protein [Candidatus Dormibacteraeota bacterium]
MFNATMEVAAAHARRAVGAVLAAASVCAVLVALMAPASYRPRSPWPNDIAYYISVFTLAQVAGAATLLSVVRLLGAMGRTSLDVPRLRLIANANLVAVTALLPVLAEMMATAILNRGDAPGTWYPLLLAVVALGALLVAVAALLAGRSATATTALLREHRRSDTALRDVRGTDLLSDAAGTLRTLHSWAARCTPQIVPLVDGAATTVVRVARWADRRFPTACAWLDIRAHPWRFCAVVAAVCGALVAAPDAIVKGEVEGPAAVVEIAAVFAGFAILGGYLGVRAPASRSTRSARQR